MKFKCFSITRKAGEETTMDFIGAFAMSQDKTAMQIYPVAVWYPKLKAKALWSDDTAAVAITLDFTSVWKDSDDSFHSERTASVALYNQEVPIGQTNPEIFVDAQGKVKEGAWSRSDWLIPVVPSYRSTEQTGTEETGNFSLAVTVVETTKTGADIVGVVAETLRAKKSDIIDIIVKPTLEAGH
jgi:hypothetical protein